MWCFPAQLRGARNLRGPRSLCKPIRRGFVYKPEPGIEACAFVLGAAAAGAGAGASTGLVAGLASARFCELFLDIADGDFGAATGATETAGSADASTLGAGAGAGSGVGRAAAGSAFSRIGAGAVIGTAAAAGAVPGACGRRSATTPPANSTTAKSPNAIPTPRPGRPGWGGGSERLGTTGGGVRFGASTAGTAVRVGPGSVCGRTPGCGGAASSISVRSGAGCGTAVGTEVRGSTSVSGPRSDTACGEASGSRCVTLGNGSACAAVVAISNEIGRASCRERV